MHSSFVERFGFARTAAVAYPRAMRLWLVLGSVAACGGGGGGFVTDAHIIVDGFDSTVTDCRAGICQHNENTDLTVFDGATYLVHRTAVSQVLGPNSSLRISRSEDHGRT